MFQDSISLRHTDLRRRRRFKIGSRTYFGYALALVEGALAATILLLVTALVPHALPWGSAPSPLLAAAGVGIFVALSALRPLKAVLDLSSRRLFMPEAALSFLLGIGVVWLGLLVSGITIFSTPTLETWKWLALAAVFAAMARGLLYGRVLSMLAVGQFQIDRTALIGDGAELHRFEREAKIWKTGGQVISRLAFEADQASNLDALVAEFLARCADLKCDRVILVGASDGSPLARAVLDAARFYAIDVAFAPVWRSEAERVRLLDVLRVGPTNAVHVLHKPLTDGERAAKRVLDLLGASVALLLSLPLLAAVSLAIRLDSPGPILYRQERRGFNGQTFHILKFRSMRVTEDGRAMRPAQLGDSRITRVGRFIRRTSVDELPQLVNVLAGTMSLVGPRPHAISHDAELSRRFALYASRQRIKPGITGWAQVNGSRGEIGTQMQLEDRTLYDLEYVENWSLLLELKILWLTVFSRKVHTNAR